jgi:sugar-specific transcriptional regulator TrmB
MAETAERAEEPAGPSPDAARLSDAALLAQLAELGLTPSEASAYLALLRAGGATAAEVARATGVSRPKTYQALASLETQGFCTTTAEERASRFQPVPPEAALRGLLRRRDEERESLRERERRLVGDLARALPAVEAGSRPAVPEYLEIVSGRFRTTEVLEQLTSDARETLLVMHRRPFLQPRSRWNLAEIEAVRRGVSVRVIYTDESLDERGYLPLVEAGAELRACANLPMKLALRDGEEAMIALRDPATGEQGATSVIVRHPDLVSALELLFEKEWSSARTID